MIPIRVDSLMSVECMKIGFKAKLLLVGEIRLFEWTHILVVFRLAEWCIRLASGSGVASVPTTKAELRECEEIMKVVRKYEQAAGQCINFEKSSLLFGKRINENVRQQIKDTIGIQNEGGMGTYLGIPEDIIGSKCKLFAFLKDKLMHRVNRWTGRCLSKGGKEVLIKYILLALPTYVMSSFFLPLEI